MFIAALGAKECGALAGEITGRGGRVDMRVGDLCDEAAAAGAVAQCVERFGRLDGVFAAAGASARGMGDGPAHEASRDGFQAAFQVNAWPALNIVRGALPVMLEQAPTSAGSRGSLLLMSSVLANRPAPEMFDTHGYAAAKGAIESLTRSAAARYAGSLIRVNALAPGLVATPMSQRARDDDRTMRYVAAKQPLAGGPLPAEDVGALVAFLLSDEARYITGQVIAYDGGWSVTDVSV